MTRFRRRAALDSRGTDGEKLLDAIHRLQETVDPVPDSVLEAARALWALRDFDTELAELVADSAAADGMAAVRAERPTTRMLSFASSSGCGVEIEVVGDGGRWRVLGQLSGACEGPVILQRADGKRETIPDRSGRFVIPGLSAGLLRLVCSMQGGRGLATSWVRI